MLHINWCNIHTERCTLNTLWNVHNMLHHVVWCFIFWTQCTCMYTCMVKMHLFWFEGSKCSGFGQPVIINSTRLSNAAGYKGCALPYQAILDCALPYQAVLWRAERLKQNQIFPISHRQSFLPHLRPNTPSLQIGHTQTLPNLCHQLIKQSQPWQSRLSDWFKLLDN